MESDTKPDQKTSSFAGKKELALTAALVALLVGIVTLAYRPVLFDFFAGDDFVHLLWLKDAVINHELIWRNFHSSWLDGTTTKFYRPLISVFMVSDYVLGGRSGLIFHITNLVFHLIGTVSTFFIARYAGNEVSKRAPQSGTKPDSLALLYIWPFFAAALFGLYPLHTEAVSWITGRVDAVVTAFITFSIWSYLKARRLRELEPNGLQAKLASMLCVLSMVLALLSKEMAITLPVTFFFFEIVFPQSSESLGLSLSALIKRGRAALANSYPYFIILVLYFAVRRLALGTFVGGYDDSAFFIPSLKNFIYTWLCGLRILFEPFNRELVSVRSLQAKIWDISLGLSITGAIVGLVCYRPFARLYLFLLGWFVLCLLPAYKVFAISDDLQGGRLAHVATVPLSLLLMLAAINLKNAAAKVSNKVRLALAVSFGTVFLICAAVILNNNNVAWVEGGKQANDIRAGLSKLYGQVKGDPQMLFVGLPDQEHGAYICRNALPGMTRTPQLERDIINAILVDRFEPIFPFAHNKASLYSDRDKILIYRWDRQAKEFKKVDLNLPCYPIDKDIEFKAGSLKAALAPQENKDVTWTWQDDGLYFGGTEARFGRPEAIFTPGPMPCFSLEFVRLKIHFENGGRLSEGVDLLYRNDLVKDWQLKCRTHASLTETDLNGATGSDTTIILPLRSLPEWSLGGQCHDFTLKLPHGARGVLKSIEIVSADRVIPKIDFPNSGYLGSKGYVHVGAPISDKTKAESTAPELSFDVSGVFGAQSAMAEMTRTNLLFEEQNSTEASRVAAKTIDLAGKSGKLAMTRDLFKSPGIYQIRIWAKDKDGKRFGQSSDHIVISVDN